MPFPGILLLIQNYLVGTIKKMPAAELVDVTEKPSLVLSPLKENLGVWQKEEKPRCQEEKAISDS